MNVLRNRTETSSCRAAANPRMVNHAMVIAAFSVCLAGCGSLQQPDYAVLETVDFVDVERYAGKWYEIARYPNDFETGCFGVTADYRVMSADTVEVINTCRTASGSVRDRTVGSARIDDKTTNAKLKVTFFWPFSGAYWIIDLDDDYQYAVVGEPSRNFFWILSRTPTLDQQTLDAIFAKMPGWRYDPDRLIFTPQDVDDPEPATATNTR